MIISHKYQYLFVELPHTASTAIRRELETHYDGSPVLHKHATYSDFERIAQTGEKRYFVFSCIRNPLDVAVTVYHKCRNRDRRGGKPWEGGQGLLFRWLIARRRQALVKSSAADFSTHFMRTYRLPYSDWSGLDHSCFDYVIRYESLQEDFAQVLERLGIAQKRPLVQVNKTPGKDTEFWSYYTPQIRPRAKWVFGPYMREWDYSFPEEWGAEPVYGSSQTMYRFISTVRNLYWKHLRWRFS